MAGFFSDVDDTVNDTVGWENIVKALAAYFTGGTSMAAPNGGFEWLPSGEMTVADGASAIGGSSGGTNFLSNLFAGSSELAPMGNDYSRMVEMYPTSSGNIFEPAGMSPSQISSIQGLGDMSLLKNRMTAQSMPNFGGSAQQQSAQQLAQLNQGGDFGNGMRQGQAVPESVLASLLDPAVALKAYRPTLI